MKIVVGFKTLLQVLAEFAGSEEVAIYILYSPQMLMPHLLFPPPPHTLYEPVLASFNNHLLSSVPFKIFRT